MGDRRVSYELVSAGYFEVLGIPLHLGRSFAEREDRVPGSGRAVIVSHRLWQEGLGGRPLAVGDTIVLDGLPFSIVGVAAPSFDGVRRRVDLWLPFAAWPRLTAGAEMPDEPIVEAAGRLAPEASAERARAELATVSASFRRDHHLDLAAISVWPTNPYSRLAADERGLALHLILLTPTLLTLVACANVANLLLARGNARRAEIAVRLALGGSRTRLARRFFADLEAWAGSGWVAVASSGPLAGPWVVEVSRHYFDLLRIPIVAGRAFDATDPEDGVVVVNEAAARRFLPDGHPVGRKLGAAGWVFTGKLESRDVVGVARKAQLTRGGPGDPVLFVPTQPAPEHVFLVGGPRGSDPRAIAAIAARLDSALYADAHSGRAWQSRATSGRRLLVKLLGGFGALALFLSTVGLFSVGVYGVQRRRREIGIRMALGAQRRDVIRSVFRSAGRAMLRGFLLGGLLAAGSAYALRHLVGLNDVSPLDPATYAGVVLALVAVAALGLWLPARQALRTAPVNVLRQQ